MIANRLPENAIVCDEGATNGLGAFLLTANAAPHDWLTLTGGAIGQGLPLALGAAIACPDQKVIALEADGSGMYTVQALWTMVREQLDITVVLSQQSVLCHSEYRIEPSGCRSARPYRVIAFGPQQS